MLFDFCLACTITWLQVDLYNKLGIHAQWKEIVKEIVLEYANGFFAVVLFDSALCSNQIG
jgi:hypothetical protein